MRGDHAIADVGAFPLLRSTKFVPRASRSLLETHSFPDLQTSNLNAGWFAPDWKRRRLHKALQETTITEWLTSVLEVFDPFMINPPPCGAAEAIQAIHLTAQIAGTDILV